MTPKAAKMLAEVTLGDKFALSNERRLAEALLKMESENVSLRGNYMEVRHLARSLTRKLGGVYDELEDAERRIDALTPHAPQSHGG